MAEYKVEVTTGNLEKAGTDDHVYVTLFGINGQSERKELDNFGRDFKTGGVSQKHGLRIYIYRIFIHWYTDTMDLLGPSESCCKQIPIWEMLRELGPFLKL